MSLEWSSERQIQAFQSTSMPSSCAKLLFLSTPCLQRGLLWFQQFYWLYTFFSSDLLLFFKHIRPKKINFFRNSLVNYLSTFFRHFVWVQLRNLEWWVCKKSYLIKIYSLPLVYNRFYVATYFLSYWNNIFAVPKVSAIGNIAIASPRENHWYLPVAFCLNYSADDLLKPTFPI